MAWKYANAFEKCHFNTYNDPTIPSRTWHGLKGAPGQILETESPCWRGSLEFLEAHLTPCLQLLYSCVFVCVCIF